MTAWSNFWGLSVGAYALQNNRPSSNRKMTHMHRSQTQRVNTALIQALLGAAVGGAALANRTRITAVQTIGSIDNLGGKRTNETVALINRVTTAADLAAEQKLLGTQTSWPASYPVDKSGNGGGAKLGF